MAFVGERLKGSEAVGVTGPIGGMKSQAMCI